MTRKHARRLYTLLLRMHPGEFRRRFAREMLEAFDAGELELSMLLRDAAGSWLRQSLLRDPEEEAPGTAEALLGGSYPVVLPLTLTSDKLIAAFLLTVALLYLVFPSHLAAETRRRGGEPSTAVSGLAAGLGMVQSNAALPAFEVASVRENRSGNQQSTSNFPLNSGTQFKEAGGLLVATNVPLMQLFVFAYKPDMYQIGVFRAQLPDWARSTRFDVQAKADGNPDKDRMRLMMQGLLDQRFGLKLHTEARDTSVYALELVKPDRLGPRLAQHPADDPNCVKVPLLAAVGGAYPPACGAPASIAAKLPGDIAAGGRNIALPMLAAAIGGINNVTDRPVVDRTGLSGTFDFTLEFTPEQPLGSAGVATDPVGSATFSEALREQLGLRLIPSRAKIEVLVIDKIEKPTAN